MLKKILVTTSLILLTPNIYGSIATNSDIAIEYNRSKSIDQYINKLINIKKYVYNYIMLTGDYKLTNFNNYYGLTKSAIWNNYDRSNKLNVYLDNNRIIIDNIFPTDIDENSIKYFKNSSDLADNNMLMDGNKLIIPLPNYIQQFISGIQELETNSNIVISNITPSDNNKIWYKPDGEGNLVIYFYKNGTWQKIGVMDITKDSSEKLSRNITVSSYDTLSKIPGIDGVYGVVRENEQFGTQYIYDGTEKKWIALSKGGDNGIINVEIPNILPLVDRDSDLKYFNVDSGSKAIVGYVLGNNNVNFIRYVNYWLSDFVILNDISNSSGTINGKIFVANKLTDLPIGGAVPTGSIAYLLENNSNGYKGDSNNGEAWYDGTSWHYIVPTLDDLVLYGNNDHDYYVISQHEIFKHNDLPNSIYGYWYDKDTYITRGSRKDLIVTDKNYRYLSRNLCQYMEVCPKDDSNEPRYTDNGLLSGVTSTNSSNKFYKWLAVNTPKSINGLIDIPSCTDGFIFNENSLRCEKPVTCDEGIYDKNLNKCVTNIKCESGYSYSVAHARCEKKISIDRIISSYNDIKQVTLTTTSYYDYKPYVNNNNGYWEYIDKNKICKVYYKTGYGSGFTTFRSNAYIIDNVINNFNLKNFNIKVNKDNTLLSRENFENPNSLINNLYINKNCKVYIKSKNNNFYFYADPGYLLLEALNIGHPNIDTSIIAIVGAKNINNYCKDGYIDNGTNCKKWISENKKTCPDGYTDNGKNCQKLITKNSYICPNGYILNGSQCIKQITHYSCPTGYYTDDTKCSKIDYTNPICNGMIYRDKCLINPDCEGYYLDTINDICYKTLN